MNTTSINRFKGLRDLGDALANPHLWALLAWYDIRQRYRRSILGPFWVTLSTGIMIGTMGVLWSVLFKNDVKSFLPFFAIGNVVWTFYAAQINEACTSFTQFESTIKQIRFPMGVYLLRILMRNLIILGHNCVIIVIVVGLLGPSLTWHALFALPGLLLGTIAMLAISMIVSVFCTRFRDMPMIIQNATMVLFYVTPIIWRPEALGEKHQWVAQYNPFAHLIEIVRAPIINGYFPLDSWIWSLATTFVLLVIGIALQGRFRDRIAYWL
ncbi:MULTISPECIES: ABC transporter permease [unclassified Caballeronia]|uniref:ABC transporter permease n=1 Tax=unclassified Caballeronia TaxID=2646786 RepID=UPI00202771DD|nr:MULTISPECIES: ABC transporter permease [unclassified Caballeronia]